MINSNPMLKIPPVYPLFYIPHAVSSFPSTHVISSSSPPAPPPHFYICIPSSSFPSLNYSQLHSHHHLFTHRPTSAFTATALYFNLSPLPFILIHLIPHHLLLIQLLFCSLLTKSVTQHIQTRQSAIRM